MNRSWFRNPFASGSASSGQIEVEVSTDEDGDAGQVIAVQHANNNGRRKRRKGAFSDTSGKASTNWSEGASTVTIGTAATTPTFEHEQQVPPIPSHYQPEASTSHLRHDHFDETSYAARKSVHSIASIRTVHFLDDLETSFRASSLRDGQNSRTTSMEVGPSRTPDRFRDRMSWASTASGMIGFDDEDMLEAARRAAEEEDEEAAAASALERDEAEHRHETVFIMPEDEGSKADVLLVDESAPDFGSDSVLDPTMWADVKEHNTVNASLNPSPRQSRDIAHDEGAESAHLPARQLEADKQESAQADAGVTPSSSSSSLMRKNQESPFTTLISRLLSAQDDLISHRADQKTLLLSLINNLRGELASRDRSLDKLQQHTSKLEREVSEHKSQQARDKAEYRRQLQSALHEVEQSKDAIAAEVKRREAAIIQRHANAGTTSANLSSQTVDGTKPLHLLDRNHHRALSQEGGVSSDARKSNIESAGLDEEETRARCALLQDRLWAAEMHISRLTESREQDLAKTDRERNILEANISSLTADLQETQRSLGMLRQQYAEQQQQAVRSQALAQERISALSQELVEAKDNAQNLSNELATARRVATEQLAEKEEHIAQLETKILHDTNTHLPVNNDATCIGCQELRDRTIFLESEIVRLRELVGKMRLESADREVKVARLTKTRDQLREDIEGLNIALEAKQQEVKLLKRESHHLMESVLAVQDGSKAEGAVNATPAIASVRLKSRLLQARPSSTFGGESADAGGAPKGWASSASNRASFTARRIRPDSRRISFGVDTEALETPTLAVAPATGGGRIMVSDAVAKLRSEAPDPARPGATPQATTSSGGSAPSRFDGSQQRRKSVSFSKGSALQLSSRVIANGNDLQEEGDKENRNRSSSVDGAADKVGIALAQAQQRKLGELPIVPVHAIRSQTSTTSSSPSNDSSRQHGGQLTSRTSSGTPLRRGGPLQMTMHA